jgi:hypothetical protein
MADIPAVAHAQILRAIHNAQADVVALRKATKVKTGYMGFQHVETNLAACHVAISADLARAPVVMILKTAAGALAVVGGGDAAPVVERTRTKLRAILQEFEGKERT